VEELNPIEDENKVENEASPIEESVIKEKYNYSIGCKRSSKQGFCGYSGNRCRKVSERSWKINW